MSNTVESSDSSFLALVAGLQAEILTARQIGPRPIGYGGYGQVWKGELVPLTVEGSQMSSSGEGASLVGIKILYANKADDPEDLYRKLKREISVWQGLKAHKIERSTPYWHLSHTDGQNNLDYTALSATWQFTNVPIESER